MGRSPNRSSPSPRLAARTKRRERHKAARDVFVALELAQMSFAQASNSVLHASVAVPCAQVVHAADGATVGSVHES